MDHSVPAVCTSPVAPTVASSSSRCAHPRLRGLGAASAGPDWQFSCSPNSSQPRATRAPHHSRSTCIRSASFLERVSWAECMKFVVKWCRMSSLRAGGQWASGGVSSHGWSVVDGRSQRRNDAGSACRNHAQRRAAWGAAPATNGTAHLALAPLLPTPTCSCCNRCTISGAPFTERTWRPGTRSLRAARH